MDLTLSLTDEDAEALRKAARREGRSIEDVAHAAVRSYLEDWQMERDRFLTDFARDNRGLLERLAQ